MSEETYRCTAAIDGDQETAALLLNIPALIRVGDCSGVPNAFTEAVGVEFILEGSREVLNIEVFGVGVNAGVVEGNSSSVVDKLNVNIVVSVIDFSTLWDSCIETFGVFVVVARMEAVGESTCIDATDNVFTIECGMEVNDSLTVTRLGVDATMKVAREDLSTSEE